MDSGVHKVKIVGCYVGESAEKKTPFFGLEFENEAGERIEKDFYFSADKKDYNEKILQQLLDAGYKGKSLTDMADAKYSIDDLFGEPKGKLSITVETENFVNDSGTSIDRQVVKWFNIGGGKSKADHASAKMIFKSTTFDSLFAKLKKDGPAPKDKAAPKVKESMQADTPEIAEDDLPF